EREFESDNSDFGGANPGGGGGANPGGGGGGANPGGGGGGANPGGGGMIISESKRLITLSFNSSFLGLSG
ncbi:MAG: hypothetical protein NLN64_06190, partial [Candidatus Thalassarchaeaceae archaeon]|nr:hypothetical protein [Candidatus Thalassarchaeaceae archaeon]